MFKNARNFARRHGSKLAASLVLAAGNAMAAVDPAITTAITDGTTDGKTIAIGVLVLIIGIGIFKHVRKAV